MVIWAGLSHCKKNPYFTRNVRYICTRHICETDLWRNFSSSLSQMSVRQIGYLTLSHLFVTLMLKKTFHWTTCLIHEVSQVILCVTDMSQICQIKHICGTGFSYFFRKNTAIFYSVALVYGSARLRSGLNPTTTGCKNGIVTAFRHFPHKYCLLMRFNQFGHRQEVFVSGDDSIFAVVIFAVLYIYMYSTPYCTSIGVALLAQCTPNVSSRGPQAHVHHQT